MTIFILGWKAVIVANLKAFDTVRNERLLVKLKATDVKGDVFIYGLAPSFN